MKAMRQLTSLGTSFFLMIIVTHGIIDILPFSYVSGMSSGQYFWSSIAMVGLLVLTFLFGMFERAPVIAIVNDFAGDLAVMWGIIMLCVLIDAIIAMFSFGLREVWLAKWGILAIFLACLIVAGGFCSFTDWLNKRLGFVRPRAIRQTA